MEDVPFPLDLQLVCLHLLIYLLWKDHNEKHNNNNRNNNIMTLKLIESEKRSSSSSSPSFSTTSTNTAITAAAVAAAAVSQLHHNVQPPSDPFIASVLHSRQNPRPGRLILENVNNRPQTMDRGTQANTDSPADAITEAPTTSNGPTNNELFRKANISVTNQTLMTNGGDNSSVDSLNSADSAKRDSEESVIELAEFHQPMIAKDDSDGPVNMSNGDGKSGGAGGKPSNGIVKEHPDDDDIDRTSCGMECLYFTMQCCECSIM
ncbi:uncharacterized protein LOC111043092 isoform X2 [Myzus persicae]|uniref:uncharacterized protein LOC111043092 isoform X2 n=1 Tax=Myzus persicae TaxID=13164 RepID=UPI000B936BDD|nr:uncharacterized protein LOC111043092 isoform X2 [Myzus persicae]